MRWWLGLVAPALVALPLGAHVMSMSSGEATVNGNRVDYVLRIPYYEVEPIPHPGETLLEHIAFAGGHLQNQKCFREGESYLCLAEYQFSKPVESLNVTCTFYAVTVPNHVHSLHATWNGKQDRAFFDYTFTNAILRFRPPTAFETALQRITEGAMRGVGGAFQLLFLLTLAMSARTRRELTLVIAAYLAGLIAAVFSPWHPPERFAESAAAIGISYLAVEILFVPQGGMRWWIGALLGFFQGLYLTLFTGIEIPYFVTGAALASVLICALAGLLMLRRLPRWAAFVPLAASLFWFFTLLRK
jgi:hypothetical protein